MSLASYIAWTRCGFGLRVLSRYNLNSMYPDSVRSGKVLKLDDQP